MAFIDASKIPATGHPRIDAGHKDLADRVNSLYEMWQAGAGHPEIVRASDLLVRAVGRHFAEEEEIGAKAGYDGLDRHAALHRELLGRLSGMVEDLRRSTGYGDMAIDVFSLIDTLLYEHEIVDDQDFWLVFRDGAGDAGEPSGRRLLVVWDGRLETGVREVDEDHRDLVEWLNRLDTVVDAEVGDVLSAILSHTEEHFFREEALMEACDAPNLEAHRSMHSELLVDLRAVVRRHAEGLENGLGQDVQSYLKFWFLDHIRHVDAPVMKAIRSREGAEQAAV